MTRRLSLLTIAAVAFGTLAVAAPAANACNGCDGFCETWAKLEPVTHSPSCPVR